MRATAETSVMADIYRGDRFPNLSIAPMKILISSVLSVTVCSAENAVHPAREMKIAGMSFSVITRVARDAYDLNLGIGEPGGNKGRPFRLVFAIQDAENHYEFALGQKRQVLLKRVNGKETILAEAGRLLFALVEGSEGRSDKALGGGLPVTVKRRSSWLSVFVGGEMVLSAMDSTFAGGGVAAANAAAAVTANGAALDVGLRMIQITTGINKYIGRPPSIRNSRLNASTSCWPVFGHSKKGPPEL